MDSLFDTVDLDDYDAVCGSLEAAYLDPENDPRFLNEDDRDLED